MRARGLRPRSRAFSSDITRTAAAPSFSGHELPAVTLPPGLNAGLSFDSVSTVVPARGPSSRVTVCAAMTSPPASWVSGISTPTISRVEVAAFACRDRALLRQSRPLVLGLTGDLATLGHVLGRHPHRDVHVVAGAVGAVELRVHHRKRHAGAARRAFDARGDVLVAFARLDRVERHADRLQRGRAEATDRDRGDVVVEASQQHRVAADVVALLVVGKATAHHHVVRLAEVDVRVALDQRAQRDRGEVVSTEVAQRPFDRPADGRADCVDNDCFRHGSSLARSHRGPDGGVANASVWATGGGCLIRRHPHRPCGELRKRRGPKVPNPNSCCARAATPRGA